MRLRGFTPQAGEEVWALIRQHPFLLFVKVALIGLVAFLPLGGLWYGFVRFGDLGQDPQLWALVTVTAMWLANSSARYYLLRYRHHNQVWLVTDRRLVHIYRRHWFKGWTTEVAMAEVASATIGKPPLGRLLDYGDVLCWGANGSLAMVIGGVVRPQELQVIIERLRAGARPVARREERPAKSV